MTDVVTRFKAPKPVRDRKHLALVRQLRSCISGGTPCHPHHLRCAHEGGFRGKPGDNWVVPLTAGEHVADPDNIHHVGPDRELYWFFERGIDDPIRLAAELYEASGDPAKMQRIVDTHRSGQ